MKTFTVNVFLPFFVSIHNVLNITILTKLYKGIENILSKKRTIFICCKFNFDVRVYKASADLNWAEGF